ncbi:MAG: glutamate synthase large subunit [Bifidobacteriaceae bacterium]|jgi:glutamate synthase (NADPH/NADH) large chain|nr:glutamate synthase large subunit [Bifidobacteriaceae bacterium]
MKHLTNEHISKLDLSPFSGTFSSEKIKQKATYIAPVYTENYSNAYDKDSCGFAFVANLKNTPSRSLVDDALNALTNLEHRGATGAEENTGDGAGITFSLEKSFFEIAFGTNLEDGKFAVGNIFFPNNTSLTDLQKYADELKDFAKSENLEILKIRKVDTNPEILGKSARENLPFIYQILVMPTVDTNFEIALYRLRKIAENKLGIYFCSLSSKKIIYKGMLTTSQLSEFYTDLNHPELKSKIALVHSRFSTNTFPSWPLAQPFRFIAHNGEINTIRANRNWFNARESNFVSDKIANLNDLAPFLTPGNSDSGSLDEALELIHLSGRSLVHGVLMLVPPAYDNDNDVPKNIKSFYDYNNTLVEPWDGPAALAFTDGDIIGGIQDRNGLRPGRYWQTEDKIIMASEAGVIDISDDDIVRKGRIEPGKIFIVDTIAGKILEDTDVKNELANLYPYENWISNNSHELTDLPKRDHIIYSNESVQRREKLFGWTEEDIKDILKPIAINGSEPLGSMGTDTPLAVFSKNPRNLFDYFYQNFAQVTNPPLDWTREKIVTSIASAIGSEGNLLADEESHAKKIKLPFPVINNDELAGLMHIDSDPNLGKYFKPTIINARYIVDGGADALSKSIENICNQVDEEIQNGSNLFIITDRDSNAKYAPIPSLLITSALQHHLIANKKRTNISMIVEAGDVKELHHVAMLIGFGAAAVNPYMAFEIAENLIQNEAINISRHEATANIIKTFSNGVQKIMAKMGISTIMSYRGSELFEAIGLNDEFIEKYFKGTVSTLGGIGINDIAENISKLHEYAFPSNFYSLPYSNIKTGGEYKWRRDGEAHLFSPLAIHYLQLSTKEKNKELFKKYTEQINDQSEQLMTIRGALDFKTNLSPIDINEVESAENIIKRFSTGAMSFGSISKEVHELIATALNEIGGKSNSGEGGEMPERSANPALNSKIKQVASGRFGVNSAYLLSATDIQIKLAQGAKPGEGGHLPGSKVYPWIAEVRNATPGVDLVSPPPHHDIYSIEDLKQLIHDLKMANPAARIHVKLVSESGVGVVATGVSKCFADVVLISGNDGGTGAAPLNAIKHAGTPWELGLSETQQTLKLNNLRDRIVVQCDGQLKTGRDVLIAAALGAEEFGFATTALVVSGCVMMRKCHLNTCPVGVATGNPILRAKFTGKVEALKNFFYFIAEDIREILAANGIKTLDEFVGRTDYLYHKTENLPDISKKLDLTKVLARPDEVYLNSANRLDDKSADQSANQSANQSTDQLRFKIPRDHKIDTTLDAALKPQVDQALRENQPVIIESKITNVNHSAGTFIGSTLTKFKLENPNFLVNEDFIKLNFSGTAGQSLGAFLPQGADITVKGDANDYVAKGLSGGVVSVTPTKPEFENFIISGNVVGFGATTGKCYINGKVGERFAIRNSGATIVSLGTGDHALEYMTGGTAVILGPTGRNIAAAMSGGEAFILDLDEHKLNDLEVQNNNLNIIKLNDSSLEIQSKFNEIINDFIIHTDSQTAKNLINDSNILSRISYIIPRRFEIIKNNFSDNDMNNWDEFLQNVDEQVKQAKNNSNSEVK